MIRHVHQILERGAVVEWLERLTIVREVAGSIPARKTVTVHLAVNGYLINFGGD